jgi:hypothetical protein
MRIALGAILVFALLWFVALKPKPESGAPAPTPAAQQQNGTGLADRPNEAQSAVNSANAKNSANEKKAEQTGAGSQTTQQATPQSKAAPKAESKSSQKAAPGATTKKSKDPSAPIIASAKSGKVEVVLFWDPSGSDDRHVRQAVQQINTRNGTVKVHAIEIDDVGKYTALTKDVAVNVSPTIMIISPKLTAWKITGYTDTSEIDNLIGAVARQSEK